jgi:antirestriction protein ArdC
MDQTMVSNSRHEYAVQRRYQSALQRLQHRAVVDGGECRLSDTALSHFQAGFGMGGNVRKGEHGTKVYFVKQPQVADRNGEVGETRIIAMMKEYTVFNVDQCEGLPRPCSDAGRSEGAQS